MSDWKSYYEKTKDNPVHPALKFAQSRVRNGLPKIAVDCGCGAGRNVGYLRSEGFEVHAFDVDSGAIDMCIQQFGDDANAHFSCESFLSFDYPNASLIAATFSLFFCPATEFE
ncbi:MAG: class I SAM-dependent methyltransferase [Pseudomonadota bacterium]